MRREIISAEHARRLAALFDIDKDSVAHGRPLPLLWHWAFFTPEEQQRVLQNDGHPRPSLHKPKFENARRMWAGGRLEFFEPLIIGEAYSRKISVLKVEEKVGKSGPLEFVTLEHRIESEKGLAINEEQDIVYRPPVSASKAAPSTDEETAIKSGGVSFDPVMLFRFSACTYNAHRIHYDRTYAQTVEGYKDLIVHGPFVAMHAVRQFEDATIRRFSFQARSPLFVTDSLHFQREGERMTATNQHGQKIQVCSIE